MVTGRGAQTGIYSAALLVAARLLLAAFCIALFATQSMAKEKVVLQLIWDHQFQFAGFYAAIWKGFYAAAGLDVEIRPGVRPDRSYVEGVDELRSGRADFTLAGANALVERDRGMPISVLATIFQQSPVAFYYREEVGHVLPADLVNLRVARRTGGIIDVELQSMLRVEGIDAAAVKPLPHVPGLAHLADGRVDVAPGYTVATPWIARARGLRVRALRPRDYGVDFYGDSLVTHRRVIDRDPGLVRRFVAASLRGWGYALDNSEEIARRIANELPRTVPVGDVVAFNLFQAEEVGKLMLFPHIEPGHVNIHRWQRMHEHLEQAGMVTAGFDHEGFIFDPEQIAGERNALLRNAALVTAAGLALIVMGFIGWTRMLRRGVARGTVRLKQAFGELEESEARFRDLIENSDFGIQIVNGNGKRLFANRALARMLGYDSPDEILALGPGALVASHDRARLRERRKSLFRGDDTASTYEFDGIRKDASIVPVQGFERRVVWQGEEAAQRTFIDISERRRAEAALRESEERYRSLAEFVPEAVLITDHGTIRFCNPAAVRLFGAENAEQLMGLDQSELVHAEDRPRLRARIVQGPAPRPLSSMVELRRIRLDGSEFFSESCSAPFVWEGKAVRLVIIRDITAHKRAEQQVRDLNRELEQRVEARTAELRAAQDGLVKNERLATLGRLTATVSHELRNPLGAMRTSIYMLRNHMPSSDQRLVRAAERIDRNITRCDCIIDELLDFTRIRDLDIEPAVLDDWLGLVLDEQAVPDGVEVRRAADAPEIVVAFDADRLRRAVVNVYDNACQAMTEQAARSGGDRESVLTVTTRAVGDRAEISFRDTGPGIPADCREKIFEPLFSTKGFGVGLGLCVVRQILEQHGGGVEIASSDGAGADVVLWLPQRQYREAAE